MRKRSTPRGTKSTRRCPTTGSPAWLIAPICRNPTACHVHPLQTFAGIQHAEFTAPQHEYPSYIEIVLRVSDSRGLSGTTLLKLNPRTVEVGMASEPPGIELLAGSVEEPAPFDATAIDGSEIQISAPPTYVVGGVRYRFDKWSDDGAISHAITVEEGAPEYKAIYVEAQPVEIEFASDPPGIKLLVGSTEAATPFTAMPIEGEEIQITAPATYESGGKKYKFERWSDNGAISHSILVEEGMPGYKAFYAQAPEEEPKPSGGGSGSGGGSSPGGSPPPPPPSIPRRPISGVTRPRGPRRRPPASPSPPASPGRPFAASSTASRCGPAARRRPTAS